MNVRESLCVVAVVLWSQTVWSQDGRASQESIDGVTSTYGWMETSDGYRLRVIETRPTGVRDRLPLVYFVQWLSCDSIEISPRNDGWTQMLRGLVTGGRYAVVRVDKAGVGDSEGPPCAELDYQTELRHHREALAQVAARPDVRPDRIVVFGASMGANMAPLLANTHDVAGVAVWGGGAVTWFERLLAFDRHALELGGAPPLDIAAAMSRNAAFHQRYLIERKAPKDIAAEGPEMRAALDGIIGLSETDHYGRPFAFHHQAQAQNWQGAWSRVDVPVLVAFGEFDWFETESAHRTIVHTVNGQFPGRARLVVIPGMDHHFAIFRDAVAAFEDTSGTPDATPFLDVLLPWLNTIVGE